MGNVSSLNDEIIVLKTAIEALTGLGTYLFPTGQTLKAVAVAKPNFPPTGTQTQGLEVVIIPAEELAVTPMLNQGSSLVRSHKITLKQWNSQDTTLRIIEPLIQLLMQLNYSVMSGQELFLILKLGI